MQVELLHFSIGAAKQNPLHFPIPRLDDAVHATYCCANHTGVTNLAHDKMTPWRRVYAKFGMSQAEFAKAIKRHRSKVSRALKDEEGLINGTDQVLLIEVSRSLGIPLSPDDLTPPMDDGR